MHAGAGQPARYHHIKEPEKVVLLHCWNEFVIFYQQPSLSYRNSKSSMKYHPVQELGEPIITIPAAIKNNSYYTPPGMESHETLIRIGDADKAISDSPLSIEAARCCPESPLLAPC